MQLLMRGPQIDDFVSHRRAPANRFDFSFLEPCPPSDLSIHGDLDWVAPLKEVMGPHRKAENLQGRRHRACRRVRGQPLLRGQARAADFGSGRLSRQTARRACAHRHPGARYGSRDRFRAEPTGDGSRRAGGAWRLEVGGVCRRFCQTPKLGALYSLGELASYFVAIALHCINSLKTATKDRCRRALKEEKTMSLIKEIDYGTPESLVRETRHADDRRQERHRSGGHVDHAGGDGGRESKSPSSARPTASRPSAPAAFASSRSRDATARRPPAPRRSRRASTSRRRRPASPPSAAA